MSEQAPPDDRDAPEPPEPPGPAGEPDDVDLLPGEEPPNLDDAFSFSIEHRVAYDEVGAQGLVSHAGWTRILQYARGEYLREVGLMMEGGGRSPVQAMVRNAAMEFLSPARFDDLLLIQVRCAQLGERSARLEYLADIPETGMRPLTAETTLVCVDLANFRSLAWPQVWRERVAELEGANLQLGRAEAEPAPAPDVLPEPEQGEDA